MSSTFDMMNRLGTPAPSSPLNEPETASPEVHFEHPELTPTPGMDMANALRAALTPFNSKKHNPAG